MSHYFTYTPLVPNSVARATDINVRFQGVASAFEKLPDPTLIAEDRATFAVDTGTANSIIVAPSVAPTAYNTGLRIRTRAAAANTGATTINVSGLGVKQILRSDGTALETGDILAGQVVDLTYDGTNFRLAMAFAAMSAAGIKAKIGEAGDIVVNGALAATQRLSISASGNAQGVAFFGSLNINSWAIYVSGSGLANVGPRANLTSPTGSLVTDHAIRSLVGTGNGGHGWTWERVTDAGTAPVIVAELRQSDGAFRTTGRVFAPDISLSGLVDATSDVAAAAAGVPINGVYRNGSALMIRVA